MPWIEWYNSLAKPTWTSAPATIGMIWPTLPGHPRQLRLRVRAGNPKESAVAGGPPFAVNLVAKLIFTPIQFGMRNLSLAAVDILIVWATIIWMVIAVWRHYRWVAVAQVPYFVWVSLATVLQLSITAMNWS